MTKMSERTLRCHKREFARRVKHLHCRIQNHLHDNMARTIYFTHRIRTKMHAYTINRVVR